MGASHDNFWTRHGTNKRLWIAGLVVLALLAVRVASYSRRPESEKRPTARPGAGPRIGMNLEALVDWSREWALVDVFKASREWMGQGGQNLLTDPRGYPVLSDKQTTSTLMVRELDGHYPKGMYVATYEGKGKVEMQRWDVTQVVKQQPGRIEAAVFPANGGIQLDIPESDPKDPVRNLHVWMPGFEGAKSPFHPLFVERLKPFQVLRFMTWQKTNNSPLKTWAEQPKLEDARYSTERGAPVELLVELANTTKTHPWFCIPHEADDDYVRQFARVVKEKLDPSLKAYVEYSNEVWNYGFSQTGWAQRRGAALGLGDPELLRFYAQRSVEVFKIWEEVFGGRERLVRVLATQFVNPWASEQVLTWKKAHEHADALAIAPYFGYEFGNPKTAAKVAGMTTGQLLDALEEEVDGKNREGIRKQAEVAQKYGLELIAYEGGQHLAGTGGAENNEALTRLFIAANRHPRMHDLYRRHLAHWYAAGGGLYVVFSNVGAPSKWGSWGVLEYQDQPVEEAPKYRAVTNFIRAELPRK